MNPRLRRGAAVLGALVAGIGVWVAAPAARAAYCGADGVHDVGAGGIEVVNNGVGTQGQTVAVCTATPDQRVAAGIVDTSGDPDPEAVVRADTCGPAGCTASGNWGVDPGYTRVAVLPAADASAAVHATTGPSCVALGGPGVGWCLTQPTTYTASAAPSDIDVRTRNWGCYIHQTYGCLIASTDCIEPTCTVGMDQGVTVHFDRHRTGVFQDGHDPTPLFGIDVLPDCFRFGDTEGNEVISWFVRYC